MTHVVMIPYLSIYMLFVVKKRDPCLKNFEKIVGLHLFVFVLQELDFVLCVYVCILYCV